MNARGLRGRLDLGLSGTRAAITNVVGHRVVEQHRVLRHDADRLAHAGLGDLPNVLPRQGDAALLHVVKTEHQARQGGFTRA